ncbi:hypothetical protein [Actinomadura sp. 9N407]|uniref:hypothetical protein n=1 Tax=Actinomadura sp. 9N407 TaxID=3375154 RepID=UPI0037A79B41
MDMTVLAHAPVLADPGQVGSGSTLLFGPLIIALALITWLTLIIRASSRKVKPGRPDQSPHRGPMEGGLYHYSPGMYSHSYAPGETEYVDPPADQEGSPEVPLRPHGAAGQEGRPESQPGGVGILEQKAPRQKRRSHWWSSRG